MLDTTQDKERWDAEITGKKRLFVLHYCTDDATFLNGTASYRAAYKKVNKETGKVETLGDEVCQTAASRLLKREEIKIAISRLLKLTQANLDDEHGYKLLHEAYLYATYNPADIINKDGKLVVKKLSDLGELAKVVTDIIPTKYGLHIKLADRSKYIGLLLNYLKLVKPEIKVDQELNVVEMVQKAINVDAWNEYAQQENK